MTEPGWSLSRSINTITFFSGSLWCAVRAVLSRPTMLMGTKWRAFVVFWAASGRQGWRVRFNPSALARLLDDLLARFDPSIRSLTKKLEVLDRRVDCVSKLYCVAARCEGFAVTE